MPDPIDNVYVPDIKRVQKHNGTDKHIPQLWVVYRCPDPRHVGASKLDAYQGPPYCRAHHCYLQPVNLGVEHIQYNRNIVELNTKGRPNRAMY